MMNMNLNMNNINNMNNNIDNDLIEINFAYGMNTLQKVKCLKDELFESVINRYCRQNNFNRNLFDFYYMNK